MPQVFVREVLPLTAVAILGALSIVDAQCVTPGYNICLPAGSELGGVPADSFDDTLFWADLQSVTAGSILRRRGIISRLKKRQDALCCPPDPDVLCLVTNDEDVPFCYNQQTTRYDFSDESFGFVSNGTYYAADGTFVDYDEGYYSSADGSTGTFAPATAAASTSAPPPAAATVVESSGTSITQRPATEHPTTARQVANTGVMTSSATPQATTEQSDSKNSVSGALHRTRASVLSIAFCLLLSVLGYFIFLN
ncbi:hypothetical protein ACLMJK_001978 [Lecanora helva]